jgi:hypothetical protein
MSKVICHRLDLIHVSEINWMQGIIMHLQPGKKFTTLHLEESATYQSSRNNTQAGALLTETVTAKVRLDPDQELLLKTSLKNYVLRLYTDNLLFTVGTLEYPSILTYSSDKIFVNLSFRSESPLL